KSNSNDGSGSPTVVAVFVLRGRACLLRRRPVCTVFYFNFFFFTLLMVIALLGTIRGGVAVVLDFEGKRRGGAGLGFGGLFAGFLVWSLPVLWLALRISLRLLLGWIPAV